MNMGNKHNNVEVKIEEERDVNRALRKFKRLCDAYGVQKEYRQRKEYKKPSIKKKEKTEAARKREAKLARKTQTRRSKI